MMEITWYIVRNRNVSFLLQLVDKDKYETIEQTDFIIEIRCEDSID